MRLPRVLHVWVFLALAVTLIVIAMILPSARAAGGPFSDVPPGNELANAVEYLKAQGIVNGYSDGTFRPDQLVERAEAVKILVTAKGVDDVSSMKTSSYSDVPSGAWFLPYVEWSFQKLHIIDGPPKSTAFHPSRNVTKAEFIKMVLLSQGADPNSYSEITLPLSSDVTDPKAWYYPTMRLAIALSMTDAGKAGTIQPARNLSRADVALLLYRYLQYKSGNRTQALLTEVENNLLLTTQNLNGKNVREAEYASARALLAARGAHDIASNQSIVNAALKLTEAYRALVRGYQASLNKQFSAAAKLCTDAWSIAKTATQFDPGVTSLSQKVQKSAQDLAKQCRTQL